MNEELAYRTIAYLIGCYKNNDETTINQEEIDAINFILNENQQLKEKLEASEKTRKEAIDKLKTLGKFDGEKCTRSFKLWTTDFNELISILDIDKGE